MRIYKKIVTLSLSLCLLFSFSPNFAVDPENNQSIYITVKNVKVASGSILVAIYDNEKDYMKLPAFSHIASVDKEGKVKIETKLPYGNYAITLFHDQNSNMELDTNAFGIPKEPYGFSNNAKAPFGPPGFQATLVEFKEEGREIEILLK